MSAPTVAPGQTRGWFTLEAAAVLQAVGTDPATGLTTAEATSRLARLGPNVIVSEPPPSTWAVALIQLRDGTRGAVEALTDDTVKAATDSARTATAI